MRGGGWRWPGSASALVLDLELPPLIRSGGRAGSGPRSGARHGWRAFPTAQGCAVGKPRPGHGPARSAGARTRVCFFGYFLCTSKESDSRACARKLWSSSQRKAGAEAKTLDRLAPLAPSGPACGRSVRCALVCLRRADGFLEIAMTTRTRLRAKAWDFLATGSGNGSKETGSTRSARPFGAGLRPFCALRACVPARRRRSGMDGSRKGPRAHAMHACGGPALRGGRGEGQHPPRCLQTVVRYVSMFRGSMSCRLMLRTRFRRAR